MVVVKVVGQTEVEEVVDRREKLVKAGVDNKRKKNKTKFFFTPVFDGAG